MIEIFEPKIINNLITYPVKINKILYRFKILYTNYFDKLNTNIDGIVVMMLSIAICNKWTIKSKLPIDSLLCENLLNIVDIYKKYHHKHTYLLSHISRDDLELILDMPRITRIKNTTGIKIAPFSLGVDSLYTLLFNLNNLTHLIYIVELDNSYHIKNFNNNLIEFSKKYNKKLIIARSNFKQIFNSLNLPGTDYGVFTSDFILTASIYALSPEIIYYNGGGKDIPCLVSNLEINKYIFGNEFSSICNDALRIKKLKYILEKDSDILYFLRVCNNEIICTNLKHYINNNIYYTDIFNCGKCGKCTRTYAYLYMLNYSNKIKTFKEFNDDYLNYYMDNIYNNSNKCLATKYYDMIFDNIYKIYKKNNNNLDDLDNYDLVFENDNIIIIHKQKDINFFL